MKMLVRTSNRRPYVLVGIALLIYFYILGVAMAHFEGGKVFSHSNWKTMENNKEFFWFFLFFLLNVFGGFAPPMGDFPFNEYFMHNIV